MTLPEVIYNAHWTAKTGVNCCQDAAALSRARSLPFRGLDQKGMLTNKLVSNCPDNLGPKTLVW